MQWPVTIELPDQIGPNRAKMCLGMVTAGRPILAAASGELMTG